MFVLFFVNSPSFCCTLTHPLIIIIHKSIHHHLNLRRINLLLCVLIQYAWFNIWVAIW